MAYQETDLLKLLINDNDNLFRELIKVEFGLSKHSCEKVMIYYRNVNWANYFYVFNNDRVTVSAERKVIVDEVLNTNDIICFTREDGIQGKRFTEITRY
jgi:hypothetical protein